MSLLIGKPMKENILDVDDIDFPIYRIFSRARFLELMREGKNTLVRPRMWDDPFENCFLNCTAVTDKGEDVSLEIIRDKWYGQCWTTEKDTDSMWRIYSQNKDGIRVRTTPRKIFSPLWGKSPLSWREKMCFMGMVNYSAREDIESFLEGSVVEHLVRNEKKMAKTLLLKRNEFRHEQEMRILYYDVNSRNQDSIFQYEIDVKEVIEEVTVDPRSGDDELQMLSMYLRSSGVDAEVNKSSLYSFSTKKIRLSPGV